MNQILDDGASPETYEPNTVLKHQTHAQMLGQSNQEIGDDFEIEIGEFQSNSYGGGNTQNHSMLIKSQNHS